MLLLPADILAFLAPIAPLFSRPVWRHVQVLLRVLGEFLSRVGSMDLVVI